jgi:hypothetical protein
MTEPDDDIALAKRLSLITDSNKCFASSSAAPHAPLLDLLGRMDRARIKLTKLVEEEEAVDAEKMANLVRKWADGVQFIIIGLNAAEEDRSADVFEAIDWYNKNLADAERGIRSLYLKEMEKKEKKWQAAMDQQKQVFKAKQNVASHRRMSIQASATTAPDRSFASMKETQDLLNREAEPSEAIPSLLQQQHQVEVAFLKGKIERLANQNALLRKSKLDSAVKKEAVDREIEQTKQAHQSQIDHYTAKIESLVDANAELRTQLNQCTTPEKRKIGDSLGLYEGAGGSPKKVKGGT